MKVLVSCLSVLLLVSGNTPQVQAPQTADSCHFTVSGELAKPTISGPEDITALVHVVEQPDSPVEILTIDFRESWVVRCARACDRATSVHHENPQPERPTGQRFVPRCNRGTIA